MQLRPKKKEEKKLRTEKKSIFILKLFVDLEYRNDYLTHINQNNSACNFLIQQKVPCVVDSQITFFLALLLQKGTLGV